MKIALVGNPNTGKSSVFNMLTGMRQQIGNFPGVTVDKKTGYLAADENQHLIIDLPGTYSIYPRSEEEKLVYQVLTDPSHEDHPDLSVVVIDQSNLERNLLLFTQLYDLGLPLVMVLNMSDVADRKGISINRERLEMYFPDVTIVETNAKLGLGKDRLLKAISEYQEVRRSPFVEGRKICSPIDNVCQEEEVSKRFEKIKILLKEVYIVNKIDQAEYKVSPIDRILVHPLWGYLIFIAVLMIVFQFIFFFASYPMDAIDALFTDFSTYLQIVLPKGVFTDLVSQGIVPGIGGVVVFIPQIALLFFFIALLEETGYLARVVFIMDRIVRPLGLNGKSVVPLISSVACAIPGVMSTRTISDWKERLITILIAPLMSCSARIPVYTLLITLVIPEKVVGGVFNLQGLVLFGLYGLGLMTALVVAFFLKHGLKTTNGGYLLLELPGYKTPIWKNVGLTVWEKIKVFTLDAGKIILAISVILWALATYGPGEQMQTAESVIRADSIRRQLPEEQFEQLVASAKLEHSYIGQMGKLIEPVIQPLGYDWKIGISLITSFAAREVFVGSLATIYATQDDGSENNRLIDRLRREKRADGSPVFGIASGVSLMVFYVYAMQCMATLAVVKRETKSWKWPLFQLAFMGVLAYLGALIVYNILK
jgi:ferrous iron transport protein B